MHGTARIGRARGPRSQGLDKAPYNAGMSSISLHPIAIAHTPYAEKFGIPRQAGIAPSAEGRIELLPPYDRPESVRGLDGYTHIWLIFVFHGTARQGWHPTVRPPRLGGNQRLGVFASRSTFRPNPLGLSCVRLLGIEHTQGRTVLRVAGLDLLDGTPIVDIKPYIPFADCLPQARAALVPQAPPTLDVHFNEALPALDAHLRQLLQETLGHDPRPAYQDDDGREYGLLIGGHNVRFRIRGQQVEVFDCAPAANKNAVVHHDETTPGGTS